MPPKKSAQAKPSAKTKRATSASPSTSAATEKREGDGEAGKESFPVVGIGASAGGLEAFRQLLDHLPVDTGMAFVLVQHLDPTHKSILTELLARSTQIPVSEVSDGMRVEPDHVYVIPPNTGMGIAEGVLRLRPREEGHAGRHPVDAFLRALAEDQGHRAVGVILSGTDSDGTLGLEAIKAEGGITFAQEPESAKYDGMPRSAIASGHVDFILTPEGIAGELARISRHPFIKPAASTTFVEEEQPTGRNGFRKVLALLHKSKGVDFTNYKANTLHRRIARRMVLNKLESVEDYARYLREHAAEVEALYQDILINVTSFFRNPETFEFLKGRIFPQLVAQRTPDESVRIWTLGCSTGEEAYSIAMAFAEFAEGQKEHIPVQIFATDLSDRGIEKARGGLYSKEITEDVSPERLRRFFTEADGGYRVGKPIRDMVVFARQNVIADPPFSRLDLISCRNLLIYLEPVLQKQVLPMLHYALKPTGVLWLGSSETPGASSDLFAPEDKKHRFYTKKPAAARLHLQPATGGRARDRADYRRKTNLLSEQLRGEHDAQREADRILLARYSPAGVVVNVEMEILQFRGSTGAYLEPPPGKATLNLLKMAREGLTLPLRSAVQQAKKDDRTIRKEGVRVNYDGEYRQVNLEVIPIKGPAAQERCFLVLFEPVAPEEDETVGSKRKAKGGKQPADDGQAARLQEELAATREHMQSLVEQQEAANEELQSASEEIQSSNEELQSINEELETSKEELESSNEELATLNDELHNRNQELITLNDDLNNLYGSINVPILFLGRDLRIRRFTPQAEKVLSLISTDVGRPVGDIKLKINAPDLEALIVEVIDTVGVREREVRDTEGRWYAMRVRPYRTLDNRIDGTVVVLVDIDALKRSEAEISAARDYAEAIIETVREPLIVLDERLRVRTANRSFYEDFQVTPEETENRLLYELGNHQWDIPALRTLLEEILPRNNQFQDFEVEHEFESIGLRTMLLNARRLEQKDSGAQLILLAIEDITERKRAEEALRESHDRVSNVVESITDAFVTLDKEWRFVYLNERAAEIIRPLRQSATSLLGKNIWEEFPELVGTPVEENYRRAIREHVATEFEFFFPLLSSWFEIRAYPSRDGLSIYLQDITARKHGGDALAAERKILALIAAGTPLPGVLDTLMRETEAQSTDGMLCSVLLLDETGQKLMHGAAPSLPEAYNQAIHGIVIGPGVGSCGTAAFERRQVVVSHIGSDPLWADFKELAAAHGLGACCSTPIFSSRGELLGTVAMYYRRPHTPSVHDLEMISGTARLASIVIERKRGEEALRESLAREQTARAQAEEASRLKDEFLATVSHELRTPLTAIMGWANMLQGGQLDIQTAARAIETIVRNAHAQNQLIADLLDVSRIISGKLRFEVGAVDLVAVIEAATEAVSPAAKAKGIELHTMLDRAAGLVSGDADRLQQVVWNLLANAVKYTHRGGHVEVRLEREDTSVVIVVRDTGEGIGPETLPYIFDRFRQADGTTTRKHGGLGLGLAITRHLVEAHGGTVRAASHGADQGATFTVTLPLIAVRREESEAERADAGEILSVCVPSPQSLHGLRILVVDDERDARELLSLVLTQSGAEVRVAASVADALETLDQWIPDVLMSDIGMPGEDGYDLIREVRAREPERGGHLPALALTGYASAADAQRARAAGFQTHMSKPIDLAELIAVVASLSGRAGEV